MIKECMDDGPDIPELIDEVKTEKRTCDKLKYIRRYTFVGLHF